MIKWSVRHQKNHLHVSVLVGFLLHGQYSCEVGHWLLLLSGGRWSLCCRLSEGSSGCKDTLFTFHTKRPILARKVRGNAVALKCRPGSLTSHDLKERLVQSVDLAAHLAHAPVHLLAQFTVGNCHFFYGHGFKTRLVRDQLTCILYSCAAPWAALVWA